MRRVDLIAAMLAVAALVAFVHDAPAQSRNDPQTMIRLWAEANGACRGGPGNSKATLDACDERDAYSKRLDQLGWCYGRKGESSYQYAWHRCQANSNR